MEIINNKYRIIETEFSNRVYSSHIIKDLLFSNKPDLRMVIIDPSTIPSLAMQKIVSDFQQYSSIRHPFIVQGKHVDMVYSIDRKPVQRINYYFLIEKFDYALTYYDFCKSLSDADLLLDKYIDLLRTFELLSRKDLFYDFNSKEHIFIDDNQNIKIKDILFGQSEYLVSNNNNKQSEPFYKSPELYSGGNPTIYSTIYSLGIVLKELLNNKSFETRYAKSIKAVLEKMTAYKPSDRYSSIVQVVEDINFFCDKNYEILFENKSYYIDRNPSLVVRDSIYKGIFKGVERLKSGDSDIIIYEIKGERDTGKTKTLRNIRKQLSLSGVNIFASFDEDRPVLKNNAIVPIVSKILSEKGYDIISKYDKVREFLKTGVCKKDDYTSYSQINTFIKTALDTQVTAIIIDGLKQTDKDALEIIKYMIYDKKNREKIIIVYTTEEDISIHKTVSFTLNNLTINETTQLIKSILCIDYEPIDIATRIYKDTIGNLKHVKSILFDLIDQQILELDKSGRWIFIIDKYDDLKISGENLENPNKYKDIINSIQQEAIFNLSLFKNPSTAEEISCMYPPGVKFVDIVENLTDLVKTKIIITQFNDDGYYYEFEDRIFKKQVYESIPEDVRIKRHKIVADNILNMKFSLTGRRLDELIYHLRKAEQYTEASIYANKKAEEYYKGGSKSESFEMDKEAIEYALLSGDKARTLIAFQKAGNRCFNEGQISKAESYYNNASAIAAEIKNYKVLLVILNKLVDTYMSLNDLNAAKNKLEEIKEYLAFDSSTKSLLDYHLSVLKYLVTKDEIEEAKKWLENADNLCAGNYKKHHAWILYYKALILHDSGCNLDKLLHLQEEVLQNFLISGDKIGIAQAYNIFGFIYAEDMFDDEKAMYYFRLLKDYAEKHNLMPQSAVANFNLAETVLRDMNYEDAIKYFIKCIEISIQIKKKDLVFYAYVYLAHIMIEIIDYSNAASYIKKAEYLSNESYKYDLAILLFNEVKLSFNTYVGDQETRDIYRGFLETTNIEAVGFQANAIKSAILFDEIRKTKSNEEIDSILNQMFELAKEIADYPYVLKRFLDVSLISRYFGRTKIIEQMYQWVINNIKTKENTRARDYYDYMKFYLSGSHKRRNDLEALAARLNSEYDERLLFQIRLLLSEDYIESKDYYVGVSYIIENYITFKNRIYYYDEDILLDNLFGNIIYNLISRITSIEDFDLKDLKPLDILNSDKDIIIQIINDNLLLKNLLKDATFVSEAKKYLNLDYELLSPERIIEELKYSNIGNMEILLKQIMARTWAQSGGIFIRQESEINCIVNVNELSDTKELERIFNQVDVVQDKLIVSQFVNRSNKGYNSLLSDAAKGFMCIPIFTDTLQLNERRLNRRKILGYVYLESAMVINDFTQESYNESVKYMNLMSTFIDNFNLSLKYSIDKLTQAYNRQYFDLYIKNELENAQGQKSQFSVVIMDIDFFKSVNDRFGHRFGDTVLKKFSKIVQNSIRNIDFFARYGGEEFVLIIKSAGANEAFRIADRIREIIYKELKDMEARPITVSMGIATYPEHGIWEEELVSKADIALYKAKNSGRNKVCIWDKSVDSSEIFNRKKEDMLVSIFGENHQRANLFLDSINLIKQSDGRSDEFDRYIREVLKYFEAEKLFIVRYKNNAIDCVVKGTEDGTFLINNGFESLMNLNILRTCFDENTSLYLTDWEQASNVDELTGMPEWDSVLCTPITHRGEKKGVLWLSAPVRFKEFTIIDSSVAQIIAPIIGNYI